MFTLIMFRHASTLKILVSGHSLLKIRNKESTYIDKTSTGHLFRDIRFRISKTGANSCIDRASTQLDFQSTNFETFVFVYQYKGWYLHWYCLATTKLSHYLFRDIRLRMSKTGGDRLHTQLDFQSIYFVTNFSYVKGRQQKYIDGNRHSSTFGAPISWLLFS